MAPIAKHIAFRLGPLVFTGDAGAAAGRPPGPAVGMALHHGYMGVSLTTNGDFLYVYATIYIYIHTCVCVYNIYIYDKYINIIYIYVFRYIETWYIYIYDMYIIFSIIIIDLSLYLHVEPKYVNSSPALRCDAFWPLARPTTGDDKTWHRLYIMKTAICGRT
jgi:hypothetical protein